MFLGKFLFVLDRQRDFIIGDFVSIMLERNSKDRLIGCSIS